MVGTLKFDHRQTRKRVGRPDNWSRNNMSNILIPDELKHLVQPQRSALRHALRDAVNDETLLYIASLDYGMNVDCNLNSLTNIRESMCTAVILDYHTQEILNLVSYIYPETSAKNAGISILQAHYMRAFACATILEGTLQENIDWYDRSNASSMIRLIDSLQYIEKNDQFPRYSDAASVILSIAEEIDSDSYETSMFFGYSMLWALLKMQPPVSDKYIGYLVEYISTQEARGELSDDTTSGLRSLGLRIREIEVSSRSQDTIDWIKLLSSAFE